MARGLGFDIYARDLTKAAFASVAGQVRGLQTQAVALKTTLATAFSGGNGLAGGVAGLALAAGLVSATVAGGNFEASMNRVQALSSATEIQFLSLETQAKTLGATTQFSASQAADAMGFLAMAGFHANNIMGSLPGTLQLASAAQMDLAETADVVSNILTGYKLPVDQLSRANDVLVKTFTRTNTNLQQLGQALKFVGPVASQAGLEFEQVSAAIGLMGNAGIQGEMAGTALRGSITKLLNPSREVKGIMKELGLNFLDASGKIKKLDEIVVELTPHANDAGLFMKIFGQRAGPGMAALVGQGVGALRGLTKELHNAGGTAKKIADVQMKGFNGSIKALKSAFEGLQIATSQSGLLAFATSTAYGLTVLVSAVSALPDPVLLTASAMGGLVASVLTVGSAAALLTPAVIALKGAFGFLGLLLGPITGALGLLAAAYIYLKAEQDAGKRASEAYADATDMVNKALGRQVPINQKVSATTLEKARADVVAAQAALTHARALKEAEMAKAGWAVAGGISANPWLKEMQEGDARINLAEQNLQKLGNTLQGLMRLKTIVNVDLEVNSTNAKTPKDIQQILKNAMIGSRIDQSFKAPVGTLKNSGVKSAKALKSGLDSVDPWKGMRDVTDQSANHMMDEIKRVRDFNQSTMTGLVQGTVGLLAKGELTWKSFANVALNSISQISNSLINDLMQSIYKTSNAAGGMGNIFSTLLGSLFGGGGSVGVGAPTSILAPSYAGGFKDGGFIPAGMWGLTGENGPEIIQGGVTGKTITPIDFSSAGAAPAPANTNSKLELVLSKDLEARILQQAGSQSISISKETVADYDKNVAPDTAVNSVTMFTRAGGAVA